MWVSSVQLVMLNGMLRKMLLLCWQSWQLSLLFIMQNWNRLWYGISVICESLFMFQVLIISWCELGLCLILFISYCIWLILWLLVVVQLCYCLLQIGLRLLFLLVYLFQMCIWLFFRQLMLVLFFRNYSSLWMIECRCSFLVVISGKFLLRLKCICQLNMLWVLVLVWLFFCVLCFSICVSRFRQVFMFCFLQLLLVVVVVLVCGVILLVVLG